MTMKYHFLFIATFSLIFLISCGPPQQESGQSQEAPGMQPQQEQPASIGTTPEQPVESRASQQMPATENASAEVMLNPPHGEPYHRCDIPVGAPLNSKPANASQPATGNNAQAAQPQSAPATTSTANNPSAPTLDNLSQKNATQKPNTATNDNGSKPKLNPAHGQPYHRCDIPVGSPLP